MHKYILTALLLFSHLSGFTQTSKVISGKTSFSIKYWAGTCKGTFNALTGKVVFDHAKLSASSIDVTVPSVSFHTASAMRDRHMKKAKYLNTPAFPLVRFTSGNISEKGDTYYASGKLEIKGISKQITLPFKARKQEDGSYAITSDFSINRLGYNVGKQTAFMKDEVMIFITAVIK